jgi:CheY-like chemotaxis protein
MPGPVRSVEVARQAKQMFPDIEVLFTSGYTQNAIVHGGRLDPGVELISKPYRREELARKIRQMFGARKESKAPPPAVAVPVPERAKVAQPAAGQPLSILVVEDEQDARTLLTELLLVLGHTVEGVASAEDALETLADKRFDILLTDYSLPGMCGLDLANTVVQRGYQMKIIFSSGYGAAINGELKFEAACLPKPFTLASLQQVLEEATATSRA